MSARPFRTRDKVIVHWGNGRTTKGRVICHNRRSKYGLSIVILFESQTGDELPETFKPDGKRWSPRDTIYITHSEQISSSS